MTKIIIGLIALAAAASGYAVYQEAKLAEAGRVLSNTPYLAIVQSSQSALAITLERIVKASSSKDVAHAKTYLDTFSNPYRFKRVWAAALARSMSILELRSCGRLTSAKGYSSLARWLQEPKNLNKLIRIIASQATIDNYSSRYPSKSSPVESAAEMLMSIHADLLISHTAIRTALTLLGPFKKEVKDSFASESQFTTQTDWRYLAIRQALYSAPEDLLIAFARETGQGAYRLCEISIIGSLQSALKSLQR